MPKSFEFEGQHYDFSDDVSDDEALGFINKQHPPKAVAAPPPAPTLPPAPPPEPSIWERTKSAAGTAMGVLGTPVRGLAMMAELAKAKLSGTDPELTVAPDYNPVTGHGVEVPGLGEKAMQGLEDLARTKVTYGPGGPGDVQDIQYPAAQSTGERTAERDALLGKSALGQVARYGRAAGTTGLGVVTDPSMMVLGPLGQAAQQNATAAKVFAGLQRGLQAGIGIQSVGGVQEYVKAGEKFGYDSPEANNIGADVLANLTLVAGLEAEGHGVRKAQKAREAANLPKPPTLEEAVAGGSPADKLSVDVLPEAPVAEGVSSPTAGPELEARFKEAAKQVKAQEKSEAKLGKEAERERIKAAQSEVRAIESNESLAAKNEATASTQEARLIDQIERAQALEEARRRNAQPAPVEPINGNPSLPGPPGEAPGDGMGGGAQGSAEVPGESANGPQQLPPAPPVEGRPPAPEQVQPGQTVEGEAVLQPGRDSADQVLGLGAAQGSQTLSTVPEGALNADGLHALSNALTEPGARAPLTNFGFRANEVAALVEAGVASADGTIDVAGLERLHTERARRIQQMGQKAGPDSYAREAPIVKFRRDAQEIEANLTPPADGTTRLWRGNRPGEVGSNTRFTDDLPGIALPFREMYGGELSYIDVPTAEVGNYTSKGGPGEFNVTRELGATAKSYQSANSRRASMTPHVAESVADAIDAFEQRGGQPASRAEILTELAKARGGKGLRPSGDRIQLAADEVERYFGSKDPRGLPAAPDELTETQGSQPELPRPPKTMEERMAEKEAALRGDNPVAHEDEFTETGNVAEGTDAELGQALERNLNPLKPGQETPMQFDQPRVSEATALAAREEAANSPAHRKATEVLNQIRQLFGEELGTREGQGFRPVFDVAAGELSEGSGAGLPVRGYTSKQGRGMGTSLPVIAKTSLRKYPNDPVRGFVAESFANQLHENIHEEAVNALGEKDTAHTDKVSSDLTRDSARKRLQSMTSGVEGGAQTPIFAPEEINHLIPPGAEKLTQGEKFNFLNGIADKMSSGAFDGLLDAMTSKLSKADIQELAAQYDKLTEGLKAEKGKSAELDLAEKDTLPSAPDELDMKDPERGAMAGDLVPVLGKAIAGAVGKAGDLSFRAQQANAAGGIFTVINNTYNTGGKATIHEISDAIWGVLDKDSAQRSKVRLTSIGDGLADMFDAAKMKYQDSPNLSKSGKDIATLEAFGRKHLPRLTNQTFGMYAQEAVTVGGENKMTAGQRLMDRGVHAFMLPAMMTERAITVNQIKTSLAPLMKKSGITDLGQLVRWADRSPQATQKLKNAFAKALGEANAIRYGRSAFVEEGKNSPVAKLVQGFNDIPGWGKVATSNLIGTPFVKATLANAFTDAVEFFPVANKLSKRVRYAGELEKLEKQSEKGTLDKEGKRRLHELQENGPYGKQFIRGQAAVGPIALSAGLLYGMYQASNNQAPGTLKSGEDEKGYKTKNLQGALGSAFGPFMLGEYMGRAYKGNDPRLKASVGKTPDIGPAVGAVVQQKMQDSTLGEIVKSITGAPQEQTKLKELVDKYMSDLGRSQVPSIIGDWAEAGEPAKKPELPVKGERLGVDALARGVASKLPGARDNITSAIDPSTGETKMNGPLPLSAGFAGREKFVSNLESFLDSHKSTMNSGALLPRQSGTASFDKNTFEFWKKGLKDEERVTVGRKPDGSLKKLSISTLVADPSVPDDVKAGLLEKALPSLVKESSNYATRKAILAAHGTGKAPEVPDQALISQLRKEEKEELLKAYGVPKAKRRRLPNDSRGLTRQEQQMYRDELPEAPQE